MTGKELRRVLQELSDHELLRPLVVFDGTAYVEVKSMKHLHDLCYMNVSGKTEKRTVIALDTGIQYA